MIKGNKGKRTIGLILENNYTDFGEEFILNVQSGIRQHKDLNLVVISGRFDGTKDKDKRHHRFFQVYNSIYQLEKRCKFDGLIICLGSMENVNAERIMSRFRSAFPDIPLHEADERFTSVLAHRAMIDGGMRRKQRQDKAVVDRLAACIILEDWMSGRGM